MSPQEAAAWMFDRFSSKRFIYQEEAAAHLLHLHDRKLAHYDGHGNVCLGKDVLNSFNKLTPDAVYERSAKFWRYRLPSDQPGRQQ